MARKKAETEQAGAAVDEVAVAPGPRVEMVPVSRLVPASYNPRQRFENIEELADSILGMGLMTPLMVRELAAGPGPAMYEVVAGGRRLRACQRIAETRPEFTVPCIVRELTDEQALELAVLENNQRSDLDPIEEARGFEALIKMGASLARLTLKLGRSKEYIQGRLGLLTLSDELQEAVAARRLSVGAAKLLAQHGKGEGAMYSVPFVLDRLRSGARVEARNLGVMHRSLVLAVWDTEVPITDPSSGQLLPACARCPKRTDAQTDLIGDEPREAACLDADCWAAKMDVAAQKASAHLTARGASVGCGALDFEAMNQRMRELGLKGYRPASRAELEGDEPIEGAVVLVSGPQYGRTDLKLVVYMPPEPEDEDDVGAGDDAEDGDDAPAKPRLKEDQTTSVEEAQRIRLRAILDGYRADFEHAVSELGAEDITKATCWRTLMRFAQVGTNQDDQTVVKRALGYLAPTSEDINETIHFDGFLDSLSEPDCQRAALLFAVLGMTYYSHWTHSTRLQHIVERVRPQVERMVAQLKRVQP